MPPYRTILSNEEPLISYLVIYLSSSLSLITDYCSLITDYCSLITDWSYHHHTVSVGI